MSQNGNQKKDTVLAATALLCIGVGLVGMYFFIIRGIKPDWLQLNVFTLYSKYLETKSFTIIQNNQGDELSVTIYWIGWLLILYRQKKSFFNVSSLPIIIFVAGYLFLHGLAIIYFSFIFIFCFPLFLLFHEKNDGTKSVFPRH